jgi:integrase/recombinase XerD
VARPRGRKNRRPAPDPIGPLPLTRAMEAHFEWMLVTGYTADTVRTRRIAIRRFIAWCDERGLADPREITKPILERYQRHLFYYRKPDGAPLTLGSQHATLAPLKTFSKWLARENHILYNPASELELPAPPKQLPRILLGIEGRLGAMRRIRVAWRLVATARLKPARRGRPCRITGPAFGACGDGR